eukprot:XP_001694952.1 predicted protein [Chlamydomonas reinhardtii]
MHSAPVQQHRHPNLISSQPRVPPVRNDLTRRLLADNRYTLQVNPRSGRTGKLGYAHTTFTVYRLQRGAHP